MKSWRFFRALVRAGGVRRKLLALLVLFIVVVALLPLIVAKTPLLNVVLAAALPGDVARVSAHDASLSWIGQCSLGGVEVRDPEGNLLLAAQHVSVNRPPLSMLIGGRDLGTIKIDM